jgi:murein DD-endopeptidase MepM/ murein hydrolase activator NlpD
VLLRKQPIKHEKVSTRSKKFFRALRHEYRLSLLKEASYEEQFSLLLTPLNVILLVAVSFLIVGGITYAVTALTPLREYVVPGYIDEGYRKDAYKARLSADSLQQAFAVQQNYLNQLHAILSGNAPIDTLNGDQAEPVSPLGLDFQLSETDSLLRARIAEEDRFSLRISGSGSVESRPTRGFLFKPVDGSISAPFDADIEHYGVDLVAPANSVISAALDGTVIMANFVSDGGHVIILQHESNLLTVYKHNSALLREVGEQVRAGESIAIIGNTGENTDGPHLHFEVWQRGVPTDPLQFLILDE